MGADVTTGRGVRAACGSGRADQAGATQVVWLIRVVAWTALGLTVWLAGPRALAALDARFGGVPAAGPDVAIDRLQLGEVPAWLRGSQLRAFLGDLQSRLRGSVRLMDESAALALKTELERSSWLTDVRLERAFPDRFRVTSRVRRPWVQVVRDGAVVALVDGEGIAMPPMPDGGTLPSVDISQRGSDSRSSARDGAQVRWGERFPDARAVVAARIARDWDREVRAACVAAPELVAIDADNLGFRYIADLRYSQVLVALRRADGGVCWLHHGLAVEDGGPVDSATRVEVLERLLAAAPGLSGIDFADLRRRNLWRDAVRPPLP